MNRTCHGFLAAVPLLLGLLLVDTPRSPRSSHDTSWPDAVARQIERGEYRASPGAGGGLAAPNRAHNLRIGFESDGLTVTPRVGDGWSLAWRTTRIGRASGPIEPLETRTTPPRLDGARVVYARGALDEWYENTEAGLEQGFTVHARV